MDLHARPSTHTVHAWTAAVVPGPAGNVLDNLLLVVTDLVGNAYDHGHRSLRLRLFLRADRVRVEVDDTCPAPPVLGRPRPPGNRGHSLPLLDALPLTWSNIDHATSRTVWADLARPRSLPRLRPRRRVRRAGASSTGRVQGRAVTATAAARSRVGSTATTSSTSAATG
ncbi:hypothetical protein LZG04_12065 [Saccharothrix sp. S26]|uniref:hypothetical protein n=1 Tax=Saccharothrix sp. S26 TaxID=2907215 RepID=UPI001F484F22|nr:hypothetical protein [Saccharothrix sp. S26]MCE6995531.1 hypothetical protein [Saccharothrix sp. S26]